MVLNNSEDLTVQHAVNAINRQGSRTQSAYEFYLSAPGSRQLQHLVVTCLAELGYARGGTAWSKRIEYDDYEAGLVAMKGGLSLLAELEIEKGRRSLSG